MLYNRRGKSLSGGCPCSVTPFIVISSWWYKLWIDSSGFVLLMPGVDVEHSRRLRALHSAWTGYSTHLGGLGANEVQETPAADRVIELKAAGRKWLIRAATILRCINKSWYISVVWSYTIVLRFTRIVRSISDCICFLKCHYVESLTLYKACHYFVANDCLNLCGTSACIKMTKGCLSVQTFSVRIVSF